VADPSVGSGAIKVYGVYGDQGDLPPEVGDILTIDA